MVIVDHSLSYATSSEIHNPAGDIRHVHRRYPSIPAIKELENRGNLWLSQEDLATPNRKRSVHEHRKVPSTQLPFNHGGIEPSIVSTMSHDSQASITRKRSKQIKREKRKFMTNLKELNNQFFYPVSRPKRKRSRCGKYRNCMELQATMDYITVDPDISRDLFLNQTVRTYEVPRKELVKINPQLRASKKVITFDSNNNIIVYTPNPSNSKNSVITNAEARLDQELQKLKTPCQKKRVVLPEYKIPRPYFSRYDTVPLLKHPAIMRTRSLPTKSRDKKVDALWNLYLRRVVLSRIVWRLAHSNTPNPVRDKYDAINQNGEGDLFNRPTVNTAQSCKSITTGGSSVDTKYFMNTELLGSIHFPPKNRSSSSDDVHKASYSQGETYSDDDINEPLTDDDLRNESIVSNSIHSSSSPTRQAMFDSLEQLLVDVSSVISQIH